jgi:hypothetical protein
MVGVYFWGSMVNHNWCISHGAIGRNVSYFLVGEEKDIVGSIGDAGFPLCQAVHFLAHRGYPEMFVVGVVHQLTILHDAEPMN